MKKFFSYACLLLFLSCQAPQKITEEITAQSDSTQSVTLTLAEANRLALLPQNCIQNEYPNKPGATIERKEDLQEPTQLHPAFHGCFDWHSSVHGHWMLVNLLKQYPQLDGAAEIKQKLASNISRENILAEVAYFKKGVNKSFERTYGWAWLLQLATELHTWDTPLARRLEANLQPLTTFIVDAYLDFLPKLIYPIRVGEHTNTAFGLTLAYDYAVVVNHQVLKLMIVEKAKAFYLEDAGCPMNWEPSGFDFLSPCLEEANLMRRVLGQEEFRTWLAQFMPTLGDSNFQLEPGRVSDRTDGKLVHLDGLNFSRAWCLAGIAKTLPEYGHLFTVAQEHIAYSLPNVVDGAYEGEHWLASFAIHALNGQKP